MVMEQMAGMIANQLERQVDEEINRLDNLGETDIASLRQKRMAELAKGHGEYTEVLSEKEFFEAMKGEERMICHFYRENWPCKVRLDLFESVQYLDQY